MHHLKVQVKLIHLLLVLIAYCLVQPLSHERTMAQSTRTPASTGSPTVTPTATLSTSTTPTITAIAPLLIFSTPPPVRNEPPLSSGFRNIPSVFPGIDTYYPIQAEVTFTDGANTAVTTPLDAIGSVVQILRCDNFGCDTPVGSGVIVHSSGLILTAYHVLLEDPDDLRSTEYQNFVIALTENVRTSPRPLYRASVVADKNEQDIALLAIDRTFTGDIGDGEAVAPGTLTLPALPFANVDLLFADTLYMLGYPLDGGDAVSNFQATFTSFDDNGQLIVVDRPLHQGNSGGPALALQDGQMAIAGLVIRGRSTQGRLEEEGLLRAIDQVTALNWTPRVARALGENINVVEDVDDDEQFLQISIDLSTFDLVDANLRLLFYVTDEAGHPWQLPGTEGPLVLWTNVRPSQVIDIQTIQLTVPVAALGTSPDRLRFYGLLWDRDSLQPLWASREGTLLDDPLILQATTVPLVTVPATPTSRATPTPQPTVNQQATADAIETAVAATLTALATPTPTVNLVAARLTEIARMTATARVPVSRDLGTPTFASTRLPIPEPTSTPVEEPTERPKEEPTSTPVEEPTERPKEEPTSTPVEEPTERPREEPTSAPVEEPTERPKEEPTSTPAEEPTKRPKEELTSTPVEEPTEQPREEPTSTPAEEPTERPKEELTLTPAAPKPGEEREFGGIRFVYVPAGPFIMGSEDGDSDERPQSTIETDSFWIMEAEVTNVQYRMYVEATNVLEPGCWDNNDFNGDQQPVVCISWHEAVAYADWLSVQTGLQIRLPTEAEWEKSARGEDGREYPWGDETLANNLNFCDTNCEHDWNDKATDDGYTKTAPVKSFPNGKSPYNAFDMAGNVWEWTSTIYDTNRFRYPYEVDDREVLTSEERRVVRGGSWYDPPNFARAAARGNLLPDAHDSNIGLRLVVAIRPTEAVGLFVPTLTPTVTVTPLPTETAKPQKTNTPSASTLEILVASLNVRSGPGTNYSIKSSVSQGQIFTIVGQAYDCGWFEIRYVNNQTGWISGSNELVSFTGRCSNINASAIPPTPTPSPTLTSLAVATVQAPPSTRASGGTTNESNTDFTIATVVLLEPSDGDTLNNTRTFSWQANFDLPEGYAYEPVFWKDGQDPFTSGAGYGGTTTATAKNLSAEDLIKGGAQTGAYNWGILLVKSGDQYKRIKHLGGGYRIWIESTSNSAPEPASRPD